MRAAAGACPENGEQRFLRPLGILVHRTESTPLRLGWNRLRCERCVPSYGMKQRQSVDETAAGASVAPVDGQVTGGGNEHTGEATARKAKNSRALQTAARAGFAVSGLVQIVIGLLAFQVAFHSQHGEADQSGALQEIAKAPAGLLLLGICVLGFTGLGCWLAFSAILPRPSAGKRARALHGGDAAKAVVYLALAVTSTTVLVRGKDDSATRTRDLSGALLRLPGGPVVLMLLGVAVVAIGLYLIRKGASRRFKADIVLHGDPTERPVVALGVVGYIARGIALGGVGVLVIVAGATLDPAHATGLDGALKAAVALPFGQLALIVIAAGWMASGLYGFIRAARATMR